MKVLHVITNLGQGGAEAVLYRLIASSIPTTEHVVVSLGGAEYYGPRLQALGVELYTLEMKPTLVGIGPLLRLRSIVKKTAPDVVQTWMYHADLIGGLIARSMGIRAVVWGIRHADLDPDKTSFSARAAARICALCSSWLPNTIACCSQHAIQVHQRIGYAKDKFVFIPNGYDVAHFAPDSAQRSKVRGEWGITSAATLLGMVARWDPYKDHDNLLRALVALKKRGLDFRCALVGKGLDKNNLTLAALIDHLHIGEHLILAGPRDDISAVMNALDIHVLSSAGEAFPNTVAEAMASGTPCVVTDVGDATSIVGSTGWVAPPHDPEALAAAIERALKISAIQGRQALGQVCRKRIAEHFGLERMVANYQRLWSDVAAQ